MPGRELKNLLLDWFANYSRDPAHPNYSNRLLAFRTRWILAASKQGIRIQRLVPSKYSGHSADPIDWISIAFGGTTGPVFAAGERREKQPEGK